MSSLLRLPLKAGGKTALEQFLAPFDGRGGLEDTEFVNWQIRHGVMFDVFMEDDSLFLLLESDAPRQSLEETKRSLDLFVVRTSGGSRGLSSVSATLRHRLSEARDDPGIGAEFLKLVERWTGASFEWPTDGLTAIQGSYTFWAAA